MAKKKSTAEILAQLRAEAKQEGGQAAPPPGTPPSGTPAPEPAPEQQAPPSAPADEPQATPATPAPAAPKPAARPATGARPKSTKDILAALRAESAGGKTAAPAQARPATKAAAAKPAKAAGAGAPAVTATGDRPRPSVQEMLRAAREGQPIETPAAKPAAPPKPKVPAAARRAKEAARESEPAARTTRRSILLVAILTPFALAWWLFGAASVGWALALARFMMPNVLVEPPSRFKIGPPSDYPPEMVSEKWKAEYGIWVVNTIYEGQRQIYALISVCTHLGCTPNWLQGEQKFKCPCHGSGFYISGINFEGPAPRPLERAAISIAPDGMLEVDKSRKFQQEMGQWADATSYVPVV